MLGRQGRASDPERGKEDCDEDAIDESKGDVSSQMKGAFPVGVFKELEKGGCGFPEQKKEKRSNGCPAQWIGEGVDDLLHRAIPPR